MINSLKFFATLQVFIPFRASQRLHRTLREKPQKSKQIRTNLNKPQLDFNKVGFFIEPGSSIIIIGRKSISFKNLTKFFGVF